MLMSAAVRSPCSTGRLPYVVRQFDTEASEVTAVSDWIKQARSDGVLPSEIGLFVRTRTELARARAAVEAARLSWL